MSPAKRSSRQQARRTRQDRGKTEHSASKPLPKTEGQCSDRLLRHTLRRRHVQKSSHARSSKQKCPNCGGNCRESEFQPPEHTLVTKHRGLCSGKNNAGKTLSLPQTCVICSRKFPLKRFDAIRSHYTTEHGLWFDATHTIEDVRREWHPEEYPDLDFHHSFGSFLTRKNPTSDDVDPEISKYWALLSKSPTMLQYYIHDIGDRYRDAFRRFFTAEPISLHGHVSDASSPALLTSLIAHLASSCSTSGSNPFLEEADKASPCVAILDGSYGAGFGALAHESVLEFVRPLANGRHPVIIKTHNAAKVDDQVRKAKQAGCIALIAEIVRARDGAVISQTCWKHLLRACSKHNLVLVVDEALTSIRCGAPFAYQLPQYQKHGYPDLVLFVKAVKTNGIAVEWRGINMSKLAITNPEERLFIALQWQERLTEMAPAASLLASWGTITLAQKERWPQCACKIGLLLRNLIESEGIASPQIGGLHSLIYLLASDQARLTSPIMGANAGKYVRWFPTMDTVMTSSEQLLTKVFSSGSIDHRLDVSAYLIRQGKESKELEVDLIIVSAVTWNFDQFCRLGWNSQSKTGWMAAPQCEMTSALTMCQFDEAGLLRQRVVNMQTTPYLAISHIWMEASWRNDIPCVDWPVLVSPQKAEFLSKRLFELVGTDHFWMDVLCVDQSDDAARTGVVNAIPAIYRGAEKTIIIREDGGIQSCCAKAIGYFESWGKVGMGRFADHIQEMHIDGMVESWTERLWPLQEMILSDNLLFTTCDSIKAKEHLGPETEYLASHTAFRRISDSLYCAAQAWLEYGVDEEVAEWEYNMFIKAYINNGFVARRACQASRHRVRGLTNDFAIHLNSLRVTSKPRDFVLAILPQYGWYRAPPNVKRLTFGELWIDCVQQAEKQGFKFFPTITRGMTGTTIRDGDDSRRPSSEIPLPENLGDFIKLFGSHEEQLEPRGWGKFIADVIVSQAESGDMTETLRLIKESMMFSKSEWKLAHRGDLSLHGSDPVERSETMSRMEAVQPRMKDIPNMGDQDKESFLTAKSQVQKQYHRQMRDPRFKETEGMKILNLMWTGLFEEDIPASHDWLNFEKSLIEDDPEGYQDTMLRLTALISCGFGTSCFAWSTAANLIPAKTEIGGFEILILVSAAQILETNSKNEKGDHQSSESCCVQQGAGRVSGRNLALIDRATQQIIGKFPDFTQRTDDVETNVKRMQRLYPEQNWIITNLDK